MVNPQKENGYTPIANEILEAMVRSSCFGNANGRVTWAILRKTYGWKKKKDNLSISQIVEITGLSKRTVIYAIQDLEAKGILIVKRNVATGRRAASTIQFNKHYDQWKIQNSAPQTEKNRVRARLRGAKLRDLVVQNYLISGANCLHIQKKLTTKETTKEKSTASPALKEALAKIQADGFNIYALLIQTKKHLGQPAGFEFPEPVLLRVCDAYWREKMSVRHPWPWFVKVVADEWARWNAGQNVEEGQSYKKQEGVPSSVAEILRSLPVAGVRVPEEPVRC